MGGQVEGAAGLGTGTPISTTIVSGRAASTVSRAAPIHGCRCSSRTTATIRRFPAAASTSFPASGPVKLPVSVPGSSRVSSAAMPQGVSSPTAMFATGASAAT